MSAAASAAPAGSSRGRPVLAFLLTSVVVAAGIGAFLLWTMSNPSANARFDLDRDGGFVLLMFVVPWFVTLFAGVAIGIPVLLGLRSLGLHRRLAVLLLAGLVAGTLFATTLAFALAGPFSLAVFWPFIAIGSCAGFAAAGLWWLFAVEPRRDNG